MKLKFKDLVSVIMEDIDNEELLEETLLSEAEEDKKDYKLYIATKKDADSGEEVKTVFYTARGVDGEYEASVTLSEEEFTGTPSELQQKLDNIRG